MPRSWTKTDDIEESADDQAASRGTGFNMSPDGGHHGRLRRGERSVPAPGGPALRRGGADDARGEPQRYRGCMRQDADLLRDPGATPRQKVRGLGPALKVRNAGTPPAASGRSPRRA